MSTWDIVVVGGVNTDYMIGAERLPLLGETVLGEILQRGPGGKGSNQAVAAARLGAKVALIGKLGQDARAQEHLGNLQHEGVATTFLSQEKGVPTGASLISVDQKGQKQVSFFAGANQWLSFIDIEAAREAITSAKVLIVQLEVPFKCVQRAIEMASKANVKVVLDCAPAPARPLPSSLLKKVDLLRASTQEAACMTQIEIAHRGSAKSAARALLGQGARAVMIHAGDGVDLFLSSAMENQEVWLPRLPVAAIDRTGAGDALVAAFAVALAQGQNIHYCAHFAHIAGALATTKFGAQAGLPTRAEILAAMKHSKLDEEE